jgi:Fe2+ transport system protein FeoA
VGIDRDSEWAARLRELGFENGCWVRVARGGSPLLIEIGAARIAVRAEEADHVCVRLEPAPAPAPDFAAAFEHAP